MKVTLCQLLFFILWFINGLNLAQSQNYDLTWAGSVGAKSIPIKTQVYDAALYGAVPDGVTLNTKAIQKVIDECAAKGGGIVTFAPGKYLTGSLYLKEGVHLVIPKGVTLLGSIRIEDYPEMDTRVAGIEMKWPSALINIRDQKNIKISGDGIIDGQGKIFWDLYWNMRKEYETKGLRWIVDYDCKRPRTILVSESRDVVIEDITIQQSGFWAVQLLYSSSCTVDGVIIQNNIGGRGPSTDGIDVDSSSKILIQNCDIDCNDDNICLKAGRDADGLRVNRPTEYVVIRNCISRSGGGLLTCGSETSGGIRYVLGEGLKAKGTSTGIRMKSAMNRGGTIEHIYLRNIEMENVGTVFEASVNWNPSYSYSTLPKEYIGKKIPPHWGKMLQKVNPKQGTPYFKNIYVDGVKVTKSKTFIDVRGSKESVMKNFSFANIDATVENIGKISFADDWTFSNVQIKANDLQSPTIDQCIKVDFPTLVVFASTNFTAKLETVGQTSEILAANHPEFSFLMPEMAGNLKFGIVLPDTSIWLSQLKTSDYKQNNNRISYSLSDPILKGGQLLFDVISLSNTDGIVIEVHGVNVPNDIKLLWAYGGAYGLELEANQSKSLQPLYCRNNVFSVERTAFTLYYGQSMRLRVIQGVMPVASEIKLSDAFVQQSSWAFFNSGKTTIAPALAGLLPLNNDKKEYFCIYKQNEWADYNHYMLPALFEKEKWK